jgi:hypothetical protein
LVFTGVTDAEHYYSLVAVYRTIMRVQRLKIYVFVYIGYEIHTHTYTHTCAI